MIVLMLPQFAWARGQAHRPDLHLQPSQQKMASDARSFLLMLPEIGPDLVPLIRCDLSFAGDPSAKPLSNLQTRRP
jgi:hypothetical protein